MEMLYDYVNTHKPCVCVSECVCVVVSRYSKWLCFLWFGNDTKTSSANQLHLPVAPLIHLILTDRSGLQPFQSSVMRDADRDAE